MPFKNQPPQNKSSFPLEIDIPLDILKALQNEAKYLKKLPHEVARKIIEEYYKQNPQFT